MCSPGHCWQPLTVVMGGIKNSKNQYGIDEIIARVLSYVLLIIELIEQLA